MLRCPMCGDCKYFRGRDNKKWSLCYKMNEVTSYFFACRYFKIKTDLEPAFICVNNPLTHIEETFIDMDIEEEIMCMKHAKELIKDNFI